MLLMLNKTLFLQIEEGIRSEDIQKLLNKTDDQALLNQPHFQSCNVEESDYWAPENSSVSKRNPTNAHIYVHDK